LNFCEKMKSPRRSSALNSGGCSPLRPFHFFHTSYAMRRLFPPLLSSSFFELNSTLNWCATFLDRCPADVASPPGPFPATALQNKFPLSLLKVRFPAGISSFYSYRRFGLWKWTPSLFSEVFFSAKVGLALSISSFLIICVG